MDIVGIMQQPLTLLHVHQTQLQSVAPPHSPWPCSANGEREWKGAVGSAESSHTDRQDHILTLTADVGGNHMQELPRYKEVDSTRKDGFSGTSLLQIYAGYGPGGLLLFV